MPLVPSILPALDALRGIGGKLGLRVFQVTIRRRVWTGGTPGEPGSTRSDADTLLVNQAADGTLQKVLVRQVSRKEVFASGGQLTTRDLRVGPVTPPFSPVFLLGAGGFDDGTLDPPPDGVTAVELIWILQSADGNTHGLPPGGIICEKLWEEATSMHYNVYLRATGRSAT